jgi:hypothetical protein
MLRISFNREGYSTGPSLKLLSQARLGLSAGPAAMGLNSLPSDRYPNALCRRTGLFIPRHWLADTIASFIEYDDISTLKQTSQPPNELLEVAILSLAAESDEQRFDSWPAQPDSAIGPSIPTSFICHYTFGTPAL